jgi:hypothetical protein
MKIETKKDCYEILFVSSDLPSLKGEEFWIKSVLVLDCFEIEEINDPTKGIKYYQFIVITNEFSDKFQECLVERNSKNHFVRNSYRLKPYEIIYTERAIRQIDKELAIIQAQKNELLYRLQDWERKYYGN